MFLKDKTVLVTGGTGSFGKEFIRKLLQDDLVKQIFVFSRDELKQYEMHDALSSSKVKYVLGDVRDFASVLQVTKNVDVVVHAAAMKQIPAAEKNPMEAIKTNVLGAENIVKCSIENKVQKVIALSTDKAANPANLYGATKLCSDKLMIAGNGLTEFRNTKFSVVRYGNVLGSRGSVIPFFKTRIKDGFIPITDERMTRFWLTLESGVQFVLDSLERMSGGEIFVPKIPSFKVTDVARIVAPNIPFKIIGIRPGEKLHEIMITTDDSPYTYENSNYYAIYAPEVLNSNPNLVLGTKVKDGFEFNSANNPYWHTDESFVDTLKSCGLLA